MITLTEFAAKKIKTLLTEKEETGIRAGVQGGGCSGFTYQLKFDNEKENDRVIESNGVFVYVDPKSFLYLMGTEIDFVQDMFGSQFVLNNPKVKSSCGCGVSVTFDVDVAPQDKAPFAPTW